MTEAPVQEAIQISPYAKVKVFWSDRPENYSKEAKAKIRNSIAKKYGVNKNNIDVIYRPVKFNDKGDAIEITGANIENIMDVTYQRSLMREWIKREGRTVDFDRIIKLDDVINAELNVDLTEGRHRTWSIKWLMIDNFLSFGEKNYVPFNKTNGLTVVNSVPANTGGKTTLTIDAMKFLLHGSTTKTEKNEEIFNLYSGKNELVVRGMIIIDNEEVIIERKMRRTAKKGGGWTVTNKVQYYKNLPDGSEEELNEEDAKATGSKLKATIGNEKDFEMLVLATEATLDNLIGLTTTESGKVLTRLIGLEIIELKEAAVRKKYNEFEKKKKGNTYNILTLSDEITQHKEHITLSEGLMVKLNQKLEGSRAQAESLNQQKDKLLSSKQSVDVSISAMNPSKLDSEIREITNQGKGLKARVKTINAELTTLGTIEFDEARYMAVNKSIANNNTTIAVNKNKMTNVRATIKQLVDGGICQGCNRALENVDNSGHILTQENILDSLGEDNIVLDAEQEILELELTELEVVKVSRDAKNRLELDRDRLEVEMGSLRNQLVAKQNDLNKYNMNLEAIEFNRNVDIQISMVKTDIDVVEHAKIDCIQKIEKLQNEMNTFSLAITAAEKMIEAIKKEDEIEKIFKTYIDLVGKKGISKLVLRSVLPIINSELCRLLDEVCDFEVEIFMDDKNEVQFLINNEQGTQPLRSGSGFEKTSASLALRGVLGKLSTLPMPNFISFDEVLGKVANENLDRLKPLFDKIKGMYDIVFLITHNDIIKDWADNVITVVKDGRISKISLI